METWAKIVGEFISAHSAPVALREGILYVRVLQPALHYELEQVSKIDILRKLKQRFGGKVIRAVRLRVGCPPTNSRSEKSAAQLGKLKRLVRLLRVFISP